MADADVREDSDVVAFVTCDSLAYDSVTIEDVGVANVTNDVAFFAPVTSEVVATAMPPMMLSINDAYAENFVVNVPDAERNTVGFDTFVMNVEDKAPDVEMRVIGAIVALNTFDIVEDAIGTIVRKLAVELNDACKLSVVGTVIIEESDALNCEENAPDDVNFSVALSDAENDVCKLPVADTFTVDVSLPANVANSEPLAPTLMTPESDEEKVNGAENDVCITVVNDSVAVNVDDSAPVVCITVTGDAFATKELDAAPDALMTITSSEFAENEDVLAPATESAVFPAYVCPRYGAPR